MCRAWDPHTATDRLLSQCRWAKDLEQPASCHWGPVNLHSTVLETAKESPVWMMIATLKCVLNWRLYNVLTYLLTLIGLVTSKFDLFSSKLACHVLWPRPTITPIFRFVGLSMRLKQWRNYGRQWRQSPPGAPRKRAPRADGNVFYFV